MPLAFKEAQERLADLVAAPKLWLCLRAAHDVLRWFPIIAECAGQHQWVRFRGGGPRVCVATLLPWQVLVISMIHLRSSEVVARCGLDFLRRGIFSGN